MLIGCSTILSLKVENSRNWAMFCSISIISSFQSLVDVNAPKVDTPTIEHLFLFTHITD